MKIFLLLCAALLCAAEETPTPKFAASVSPDVPKTVFTEPDGIPQYPTFGSKDYFSIAFKSATEPTITLAGPIKLSEYVVSGKLELSLRSYLELVMANNTDIQIQKLLVEPQRNAITRAFSIFDPALTANFNAQRSTTAATDLLQGATTLGQLSQPLNINYQQLLGTGTLITGGYRYSKLSTNSNLARLNPAFNSNIDLRFTQPLMRGRGAYVTKLPILVAKSQLKNAQFNLEDQLIQLVTAAENAYWDVVGARENLRVQEQALSLADASLKRAQKELELGAISSLEIYQPQAQYARAEIFVTQARYRLQQTEDALRRQISVDLDPEVRKLPIALTESVLPPTDKSSFDHEALVAEALKNRPDLKATQANIDVDDYNIKIAANNLKLGLDLVGIYTTQGRGGRQIVTGGVIPGTEDVLPDQIIPGGFGNAWSQMWGFNYPVYGFGINLTLPIKNRRAAADYADAAVNKKTDALTLRRSEQNTRLQVLNAISQVENSRASVDLARIAADLAQKRVEGDQKRYDLGTITLFFLLASQSDLTQAQSDLVNNSVQYRRNLLTLFQRTGTLLQERGVVIK